MTKGGVCGIMSPPSLPLMSFKFTVTTIAKRTATPGVILTVGPREYKPTGYQFPILEMYAC